MELISVIVPVYNVEPYLMRCVESIQRQTHRNLEIILVDDGSPDRCPQICDDLMRADPRIKVIHKENGGLGYARNSGLDIATGAYVTFVDSDDWISDTHIGNLYQKAEETQADAVIGSHTIVFATGKQKPCPSKLIEKVYEGDALRREIILPLIGTDINNPAEVQLESSTCMNLYRMETICKYNVRFLSEKKLVAEDLFFNIDFLCRADSVCVLDERGYFYYENLNSTSRKFDHLRFARTRYFYLELNEKIRQYGLTDDIGFRADRTFLMKIRVAIRLIVVSGLSTSQKLQMIRQILQDDITQKVLDGYPIESYIPALRFLTKMMRAKNVVGVYCLMKLREGIGRKGIIKAALKTIGIGK